jgi:hypothetical protein
MPVISSSNVRVNSKDYPEPISLKECLPEKVTIRIALRLKTLRRKHQIVILSKLEKVRAFPRFHQHPVPESALPVLQ